MDRPKYRYRLAFERTKQNGNFDRKRTMYVAASSEAEAKRLAKENYPDAKGFRVIGKWENTPRKTTPAKETAATAAKAAPAPKAVKPLDSGRKTSAASYVEPEELVRSVWEKRRAETVKLKQQLEAEHSRNLSRLTSDCEAKRAKLKQELALTEKAIAQKVAERKAVGLFRFEKRKSIKLEIAALKAQQTEISRGLQDLEDRFYAEKIALEKEKEAARKGLHQRVKESVPAPQNPYSNENNPLMIEQQVRYNRLIYLLLEMEPGKRYTITDMQDFPGLSHCSNSAITSLLRLPAAQKYTVRTVEQGRAYYTLTVPRE